MNPAPPIVKASMRLLKELEQAVDDFARKHKYSRWASDMRDAATAAALLSQQAFRASKDIQRRSDLIDKLIAAIDELKLRMQIAQELNAFSSFGRFDQLASLVNDLGRQCGAWNRSIKKHLNGQNPPTSVPKERAEILSTRAASDIGANP